MLNSDRHFSFVSSIVLRQRDVDCIAFSDDFHKVYLYMVVGLLGYIVVTSILFIVVFIDHGTTLFTIVDMPVSTC